MTWSSSYFAVMVAWYLHPFACLSGLSTVLVRHAATSEKSQPTIRLRVHQNFLMLLYSSPLYVVTQLLSSPQGCPLCICERVHTRLPFRRDFCGAREVMFSLFASPHKLCVLWSHFLGDMYENRNGVWDRKQECC